MRRLTFVVLTLAALYSGYWLIGANTVESSAQNAITDLRDDGWDIAYSRLNTSGFPNRFDTTITDLALSTPDGATTWSAPFVQLFALSYRPNEVIAIAPPTQTLRIAGQTLTLTTQDLRASASAAATTSLPLRHITATSGPATLTSDLGWQTTLTSAIAALRAAGDDALRAAGDDALTYDAYLRLTDIAIPLTSGGQPENITDLRFDARITTSQPLDKNTAQDAPLYITTANLRDIGLTWGTASLTLTGDLTGAPDGTADGTLTLAITNWPNLIAAATTAGLIDAARAQTITSLAQAAANDTPDISLPLTVTNGEIRWAFITLGRLSLAP